MGNFFISVFFTLKTLVQQLLVIYSQRITQEMCKCIANVQTARVLLIIDYKLSSN